MGLVACPYNNWAGLLRGNAARRSSSGAANSVAPPFSESGTGRDHNPYGYTMWLAGGGFRGGLAYGATDEFGFKAIENRVSIHDLHATMLHALGIDTPASPTATPAATSG
jgi:hypothetical protein